MVNSQPCSSSSHNKTAYFGMLFIGLGMVLFLGDYAIGASLIALSVTFNPFDAKTEWPDKSILQKNIVLGHIGVAIALIACSLFIIVQ